MNIREQIKYFFTFHASYTYKFFYILSQWIKRIVFVVTGKLHSSFFLKPGTYLIKNDFWTFSIIEPSDMHAILSHCFESSINKYFVLSSKKSIFLDIWANIGKYSIWMWLQWYKVFSFEPNHSTLDYLRRNITINNLQENICVLPYWLSDKHQVIKLSHPTNNYGVASHKNQWKWRDVINTEITLEPRNTFNEQQQIDAFSIWLIKIDVEWAEVDVLNWMKTLLQQADDCTLIVEVNESREKVVSLCEWWGFSLIYESSDRNLVFYKKNVLHHTV